MGEVGASMPEQSINPPPPPPPTTQRRPRVREVSSRFMSPAPSPSNYSPLPRRSSSVQKQRQSEVLSAADENRLTRSPPQGKQHQRAVMKLFKENAGIKQDLVQSRFQRPDTPTVNTSSKLRLMQQRSIPKMSSAGKISSISPNSSPMQSPSSSSHQNNGELARTCSLPDIRSSMPEVSTLPRSSVDRSIHRPNGGNSDSCKSSASPCSRSLDFHSMPEKAAKSSAKMGGLPLPPAAPYAARKAKKVASHQEDVHSLRLLHNHYLQWRFANAKAEASTKAQAREREKLLFSLSIRISELYDSLKCRRLMLSILQRAKVLSEVVENQMPHLEEWSSLEEDYSSSLLEAIQALSNVSLRLPLSGNIRVDAREIGEALTCANKLMEMIASHVQKFIPKAEELENLVSELARVAGGERSMIEECGDLFSKAQKSQIEECSLRTQVIQLNQICQAQLQCTS